MDCRPESVGRCPRTGERDAPEEALSHTSGDVRFRFIKDPDGHLHLGFMQRRRS